MMVMQVWVWKLETEEELKWLQFLASWVPEGRPN